MDCARFCSSPQRRLGFTLLEVMVALGLVTVTILALVLMFTRGMVMLGHSKQVSEATDAGQAILESVKAMGSGSVVLGHYDGRLGDPAVDGFPPAPYPRTEQGYPVVVRASRDGAPTGTFAVSVDVHYHDHHTVTLATYLGE